MKGSYTIEYFLEFTEKLAAGKQEGTISWIVRDNIGKALAANPNLKAEHLVRLGALLPEFSRREVLKAVLEREDRKAFVDLVLSAIEVAEDTFTVYMLGRTILFDSALKEYHLRALRALENLKDRRTYNLDLQRHLSGPCISYLFFIRDMLGHAETVEEAERWLDECLRLEDDLILSDEEVSPCRESDPGKRAAHRKRKVDQYRLEMYQSLAGNWNLPYDYLRKLYAYADTIDDELFRVSFWGRFLGNPNIPLEECRELFEVKKSQLRDKKLIANLLMPIAKNPVHGRAYFDYILKYVQKKPEARFGYWDALVQNPGLADSERKMTADLICGRKYDPQAKDYRGRDGLQSLGWFLVTLLDRRDLDETHHEQIRGHVVRFLESIDSSEFYQSHSWVVRSHLLRDYIDLFHVKHILPKVRLNQAFTDYLLEYAAGRDNGGWLLAGLLPNPTLTEEAYERVVRILENQYVGREDRLLISQRSTFTAEDVYRLWPASRYVK